MSLVIARSRFLLLTCFLVGAVTFFRLLQDIVNGTFKGFAMLRQMMHASLPIEGGLQATPLPVYIEGCVLKILTLILTLKILTL